MEAEKLDALIKTYKEIGEMIRIMIHESKDPQMSNKLVELHSKITEVFRAAL